MSCLSPEMEQRLAGVHGEILSSEGLLLADLAAEVPNTQIIVELGAYKGKASCYLAAGARAGHSAVVYSVDLWEKSPSAEYASPEIPQNWRENIGHLGLVGQAIPINADSTEAAELIDHKVGLLFVDANHNYDGVCQDIATWVPRMERKGVMVFHDANAELWGVARAIREKLLPTGRYTYQLEMGLGILRRAK